MSLRIMIYVERILYALFERKKTVILLYYTIVTCRIWLKKNGLSEPTLAGKFSKPFYNQLYDER